MARFLLRRFTRLAIMVLALLLGGLFLAATRMERQPVAMARAGAAHAAVAVSQQLTAGPQSCVPPLLDFREVRLDGEGQPVLDAEGRPEWAPAMATGRDGQLHHLSSAYVRPTVFVTQDQAGLPAVAIEFTGEGAVLLSDLTTRLVGQPLGIFADGELVAAPIVNAPILDRAIITGLSEEGAQRLADRLNAEAAQCSRGD